MGQIATGIQIRGADTRMTVEEVVDGFNSLTDAIIASGMLLVSAEIFSGQVGRFVSADPGENETLLVLPPTSSDIFLLGENLFEHPSLDGYILVAYRLSSYSSTASFLSFSFKFVSKLEGGNIPEISSTPYLHYGLSRPSGSPMVNSLLATPYRLRVSCSENHFWVYSESFLSFTTGGSGNRDVPRGMSPIAFGMFKPVNVSTSDWVIVSVLDARIPNQLSSTIVNGPPVNQNEPASYICYVCEDGVVTARPNGAAGYLIDPAKAALNGVRVQPAGMYLNGVFSTFQFGHAHMAIGEDCGIVFLDLDGTGNKQYIAAPGFGTSTPTFKGATANDLSMPILPWFD